MKTTVVSFLLLLFISDAFSQTKPIFSTLKNQVNPTLFNKDETITPVFYTIEMLGKTTWNDAPNAQTINLNPKNFSWHKDAKKLESYRDTYINSHNQDVCGRDLPIDVHSELIQSIYSKDILFR